MGVITIPILMAVPTTMTAMVTLRTKSRPGSLTMLKERHDLTVDSFRVQMILRYGFVVHTRYRGVTG